MSFGDALQFPCSGVRAAVRARRRLSLDSRGCMQGRTALGAVSYILTAAAVPFLAPDTLLSWQLDGQRVRQVAKGATAATLPLLRTSEPTIEPECQRERDPER